MKLATEKLLINVFFSQIEKRNDCWLWTGRVDAGHPTVQFRKQRFRVARKIYEVMIGPIPNRYTFKYPCNSLCVRPEHVVFGRPQSISDEFTPLPVCRERKRQLRKIAQGLCSKAGCEERIAGRCYCINHMIEETERQRRRKGTTKRNRSLTYHFQEFRRPFYEQNKQTSQSTR